LSSRNADPDKIATPKEGDKVSLRQFAALVGIDYVSAREALQRGRIAFEPNTRELDYYKNRDSFFSSRTRGPNAITAEKSAEAPSFLSVKIRKETAAAQLKEIELAKEKGQLLEKEQVKESVYKYARQIRDAVLSIPERVAADLAAQLGAAYSSSKKPSDAELERIVRNSWQKESRAVLAAIEKTPDVKNKKRKSETEEA